MFNEFYLVYPSFSCSLVMTAFSHSLWLGGELAKEVAFTFMFCCYFEQVFFFVKINDFLFSFCLCSCLFWL